MSSTNPHGYGVDDASFRAAGGEAGLRRLVDDFYDIMETDPAAAEVRRMHPKDLEVARDKLARFLCGWLGGPKLFSQKYGPIKLPHAHARFVIGPAARDAWLACMAQAVARQPFEPSFAKYLMEQLAIPAERIVRASRYDPGAGMQNS